MARCYKYYDPEAAGLTSLLYQLVITETSHGKVNVLLSNPAESIPRHRDAYLPQAIMPHIPFLFVSSDNVVSLTSDITSRLSPLRLTLLPGVPPAHQGLAPFGLSLSTNIIIKEFYIIFTIHGTHKV